MEGRGVLGPRHPSPAGRPSAPCRILEDRPKTSNPKAVWWRAGVSLQAAALHRPSLQATTVLPFLSNFVDVRDSG